MSIAGGLVKAVEGARAMGLGCLQIFAGNPRSWSQRQLDEAQALDFKNQARLADLNPVSVHAPYLINLASPDQQLWQRSISLLADQLRRARTLGARAVVVHPGSRGARGLAWGLERVAAGVAQALDLAGPGAACWLENTAGGGGQLGGTLSQLAGLLERLPGLPVGVCLDTAHAHAAGYRLSRTGDVGRFLDRVDGLLGLDRVGLWHFNDIPHARGSHRDQHTHLGRGRLGGQAFAALLADPRLAEAAAVMETPKDSRWADRRNLAFLRRLERQIGSVVQ
ncbi:MAG: deoxyribonuclease IV [Pseudomonadota bacterium]